MIKNLSGKGRIILPAVCRKTLELISSLRFTVTCAIGLLIMAPLPRIALAAEPAEAWYPFESVASTEPGVVGMSGWLDAPAGKHGRVQANGDQLIYNGRPLRLWGINNTFAACAPEQEMAERRARFYAKYGINSVRLHKYADGSGWAGILTDDSFIAFDPDGLDRMDYYVAQLKEQGIFVKLSPTFGPPKLGPKDIEAVPFLKEFGEFGNNNRISVPHSAIFYSPEIQDLHIEQMVRLLKHRNPYTGLTYAEDPAIWIIEIINEQSVLFYTSMHGLERSSTLRQQTGERFSKWLEERYGSEEALVEAWGDRGLNAFDLAQDESLERRNILPLGNPYFWNPDTLDGSEAHRRQRHLDTLEFLTGLQMEFYERYINAVRDAGYEGEIAGSNWQAGRAYSHFANLWTDARIGVIDRHNYFGGVNQGVVQNGSMLANAGSGILSSGMQQVAGRPFMLSEWIHVWPNEWGVEGPAIIAAYGLGLQGWDVSYMFQNRDQARPSQRLGSQNWDVTAPQVLGIFPAVARQVLRGDVAFASEQASLNVHAPSLFRGAGLDFDDQMAQGYDEKSFETGKVGRRTLAVARVHVDFVEEPQPTPEFNIARHEHDGALVSSTGQLRWHETDSGTGQGGYFIIDTPATQAVVGFAEGREANLTDAEIHPASHFGAIYLSALEMDSDIAGGDRILVSAIGRARNTGQVFSDDLSELIEPGSAPVLLEPVRATIRLKRSGTPVVHLLDHDGRLTGETVPAGNGTLNIDTGRERTPYYLIDYSGIE